MSRSPAFDPVVLIHGAWQGSWSWTNLVPLLERAGLQVHALDLPGNGRDGLDPREATIETYLAHISEALDRLGGPVSLVGHSGGGVVATAVAEALTEKVSRLAYVAGMMLPSGISFAQLQAELVREEGVTTGIAEHLEWSADRQVSRAPPAAAAAIFFSGCDGAVAAAAAEQLTPQGEGGRALAIETSPERFGRLPRLYVEATQDRSLPLVAQRRMQALSPGAQVVSLPTDHAPQLSAPQRLAEALLPFLTGRSSGV